ncbi:post-GPI attachment to proteins factor 6 [Heteronotia binoei]|uniref:post-GPI attachment to proteins factor 6 n=1 Tax=Heteronotia binoei TaxID=13085 RepID=UPI00292E4C80|nr:post-GPI attachment to proteins factor 6 [Heteronotia binoei]
MGLRLLLLLALRPLLAASPGGKELQSGAPDGATYLSEYFSQSAQRLSFYRWYGTAKLFRFRVPEDTVLVRWLLQASRGTGPECRGETQVTIHFRHGAPPVINPLGTQFPANMSLPGSFSQTLALGRAAPQNATFLNLTSPAAGDWFIVAHLPEATGKIEVKGFSTPCTYTFQPDMFLLRLLEVSALEPDLLSWQTISGPAWPLHTKIFVPAYCTALKVELRNCTANTSVACALHVTLGSATLPRSFQKVLNCTGGEAFPCSLLLASPPWEKWLRITVESLSGPRARLSFQMEASFTACKPGTASTFLAFYQSLNRSQAVPPQGGSPNAMWQVGANASAPGSSCLRSQPVVREDLDVVSVMFRVLGESGVPVRPQLPSLLLLSLNSGMDSGGTLILGLQLNKTASILGNATVLACLSAASPVLNPNAMGDCRTAFFQGYPLNVSEASLEAVLSVPYPESESWFLTLQLVCPKDAGECAQALVTVTAFLSPCWNDCGLYGQCSFLRRHGYVYAGCSCKAGWSGWGCTDGTKAQSVGAQTLATLLLTLSNLMFLPAIAVALYSYHLVEASVYLFTMFFSTFYHACDQPGVAVLCIMDYDTLQFCDFLGSVVSIWVTILCMAQLKKMLKHILVLLGTLFIAMSLQLDRRGVWNMMGPCLFALVIMMSVWAHRGVRRRHCYPPCWKRWAFFLLPGICLAFIAIAVYAFMETNENYYYTHSLWHVLMAGSVAFLLPPGDRPKRLWAWSRKLLCGYQICKNDREELYAVT